MRKEETSIKIERKKLWNQYIHEQAQYDPDLLKESEERLDNWAFKYMSHHEWIDIFADDDPYPVGFVVIANKRCIEHCHPYYDWFICQAYIKPEYRQKGLMTDAIMEFINERKGLYGFDVFKKNEYANKFWKYLFKKINGIPVDIPRVRSEKDEVKVNMYAYIVKGIQNS